MKLQKQIGLFPVLLLLGTIAYAWGPTDEAYERGRDALDQQKYQKAYRAFQQSVDAGGAETTVRRPRRRAQDAGG